MTPDMDMCRIKRTWKTNDFIDFCVGTNSLLWVKFGQHINQRLCVHLTFARFVLTR